MTRALKAGMIEAEGGKSFTREGFLRAMRSANLAAVFMFWHEVERLSDPEQRTRSHARGLLRSMAESAFRDCGGVALSPQAARSFSLLWVEARWDCGAWRMKLENVAKEQKSGRT